MTRAPKWQPIETAPLDGTDVWLTDGESVWAGRILVVEEFTNGKLTAHESRWSHPVKLYGHPTLWFPLPSQPLLPGVAGD